MKKINLISLVQAYKNLDSITFENYLKFFSTNISSSELDDLTVFIENIYDSNIDPRIFDGFFVGYSIPQISKEFDLLRFGKDYVINLELKRTQTNDKIRKQLIRNHYYLSFLETEIY
ncbi:hypothetical protein, partial [Fulvivirga lutimaris]|uniref:hypothetical protein n=1 Tax=Fulvivirga lutimaris TaxID=1819566 RepID=UPI001C87B53F